MIKIWIARDEGEWDEDAQKIGNLHIFYDSPELLFDGERKILHWSNARMIAQLPSYMYPQIKDKECFVFNDIKLYKSYSFFFFPLVTYPYFAQYQTVFLFLNQ